MCFWIIFGMHFQDVLPAPHIRGAHGHFPVKTSRAQNGRIQNIHPVGGGHDNNALVDPKTVHLHQKLVQGLLPLVMPPAHAGAPAPGHSVNLVDKAPGFPWETRISPLTRWRA